MTVQPDELIAMFCGVITAVMLAGIPWAYRIHARLAVMETELRLFLSRVSQLEKAYDDVYKQMVVVDKKLDLVVMKCGSLKEDK